MCYGCSRGIIRVMADAVVTFRQEYPHVGKIILPQYELKQNAVLTKYFINSITILDVKPLPDMMMEYTFVSDTVINKQTAPVAHYGIELLISLKHIRDEVATEDSAPYYSETDVALSKN